MIKSTIKLIALTLFIQCLALIALDAKAAPHVESIVTFIVYINDTFATALKFSLALTFINMGLNGVLFGTSNNKAVDGFFHMITSLLEWAINNLLKFIKDKRSKPASNNQYQFDFKK